MRNKPDAVLAAFDAPDRISHMPQRTVTTTATQSLLLLNSDWPANAPTPLPAACTSCIRTIPKRRCAPRIS